MNHSSDAGAAELSVESSRLAVLGLGHVGLPTALSLAELGWQVTGTDSDTSKVGLVGSGCAPFYEPGLQELLSKHMKSGRFRVEGNVEEAIRAASVLFICVGTPQQEDGEADLSQVEAVARKIAQNLNGYKLIVEKSTVPAITARWIKRTIQRYAPAGAYATEKLEKEGSPLAGQASDPVHLFDVASNPEFLQEGTALQDCFSPSRVVCGVESERARKILTDLYRPLNCQIVVTDLNTAELIKHAANAFLATKISFINMVADLCEAGGGDVTQVARGIGLDPRIGRHFLNAGLGFGGYCLPKDVRAFIHLAEQHRVDFSFLKEVERINKGRVDRMLQKLRNAVWVLRGKRIAVLGLSFKPNTDDIREAPSVRMIEKLLEEGAVVRLHDPQAMPHMREVYAEQEGRLIYCSSPYEAAQDCDAVLLVTEWEEYRGMDLPRLRDLLRVPILIDGRNIYDPVRMRGLGFEYYSVGR